MPAELLAPLAIITAWWRDGRGHGQQFPAAGQAFRAVAVTEETVVADALKRVREDMDCLIAFGKQEGWEKEEMDFLQGFLKEFGIGQSN